MNDDFMQTLYACLTAGKQPTLEQTEELLRRLHIAETLLCTLCPAVGDTEEERDAYAWLAGTQTQTIEDLKHKLAASVQHISHHAEHPHAIVPEMGTSWHYNVREFFELKAHGWRAIVSSDSEDFTWIAYIERGGVRFYAAQKYLLIQDALRWCTDEIAHHAPEAPTEHQENL